MFNKIFKKNREICIWIVSNIFPPFTLENFSMQKTRINDCNYTPFLVFYCPIHSANHLIVATLILSSISLTISSYLIQQEINLKTWALETISSLLWQRTLMFLLCKYHFSFTTNLYFSL